MSRKDVPNLCDVIPTFSRLEQKLETSLTKLKTLQEDSNVQLTSTCLLTGLENGLHKLRKYQELAQKSQLCLIATGEPYSFVVWPSFTSVDALFSFESLFTATLPGRLAQHAFACQNRDRACL